MSQDLLQLCEVAKSFDTPNGGRSVLKNISLTVRKEDRIVLYGPSGCGKTTLLHLMAFLDQPTSGQIVYKQQNCSIWSEEERCRARAGNIGMVFQQFHLLPYHSVLQNVQLRHRYHPSPDTSVAKAEKILANVGLTENITQQARSLSGGEKQRLCIARAMLVQPEIFLADEPTGNLDPENGKNIQNLFSEIAKKGAAMVIATHDERWFSFANRVIRFENGSLIEESL